jgi:hypothetical protein
MSLIETFGGEGVLHIHSNLTDVYVSGTQASKLA